MSAITPEHIAATYQHIKPHIRRTPVLNVDAADFGLPSARRPSRRSLKGSTDPCRASE